VDVSVMAKKVSSLIEDPVIAEFDVPAGCEFDGSGESVEVVMQRVTEAMEFYLEALMAEERESRLSR
jgi:hypothetical protein